MTGIKTERGLQFSVRARYAKHRYIQPAQPIVIHEFIVYPYLRLLRPRRNYAQHRGREDRRAEAFEHAYALIALLHIKPAQILNAAHRFPYSLIAEACLTQTYPLLCKFSVMRQQRHEIRRKSRLTPARLCTRYLFSRYIYYPKLNTPGRHRLVKYLVEHLRIRVLTAQQAVPVHFSAGLECLIVLVNRFLSAHISTLL